MNLKFSIALVCCLFTSMPLLAQEIYPEIYPFKPVAVEEISSRIVTLSEDKDALMNIFEIEKKGFSTGSATNAPWSGPYWPLKQGMIANPYLERNIFSYVHFLPRIDDIEPYKKRFNYVMTMESQLSEEDLARLAPSEKYDLLLGNGLDLSSRIWNFINQWKDDIRWNFIVSIDIPGDGFKIEKDDVYVRNWEGICHGWAPASGHVPRPNETVYAKLPDGRKLPFYPEDIKGLVSLTWANSIIQDNTLTEGYRCKRLFPKTDPYGRYYDTIPEGGEILPRCADIHPAVMHLTLVNVTGNQGRSFIFDKDAKIAVSNQPVTGYSFQYFHPDTGIDGTFNDSMVDYESYKANDLYAKSRHPDTKFVVGVESTLIYADWTLIRKPNDRNYLKDKNGEFVYLYDLEINERGTIVGGQWRGVKDLKEIAKSRENNESIYLNMNRPDFIWVIPKDYKKYFKSIAGLEKWDIRSGQTAPESWKQASIAAHSFEYRSTETCRVKHLATKEIYEVPCQFKYPRPQPLFQVVNQLVDLSSKQQNDNE